MGEWGEGGGDWDGLAELWERARPNTLWRRHSDAVNSALIARWLPAAPGRVLKTDLYDEAVGDGLYPALALAGADVVGIDVSRRIAATAHDRHRSLDARCADVRALPFEDAAFDVVVSNSTLDHFTEKSEIARSLTELHRVLRPGGLLVLTLDNPWNPLNALAKALPRRWLNRFWIRHARSAARVGHAPYYVGATLSASGLRRLLPQLGFTIGRIEPIVHAPRAFAVTAAALLESHGRSRAQERFLRLLMTCERLARSPLRYMTGHFVAVRAVKLPDTDSDR